tara:strand:- start:947 stop:1165 length:219 start_codon:yes stop_codon:yes gene_type:complete
MTGNKPNYNRVEKFKLKGEIWKKLSGIYNSPNLGILINMFLDAKLRNSQMVLLECYEPHYPGIKNHLYPYLH